MLMPKLTLSTYRVFLIAALLSLTSSTVSPQPKYRLEQALTEAELLRRQWSVASLRSAIAKYEECLLLSRAAADRPNEARALTGLGELYDGLGEKEKALESFKQLLLLYQDLNDPNAETLAAVRVSEVYHFLGDMQRGFEYLDTALKLNRATGDPAGKATVLTALGQRYTSLGESANAVRVYRQALKLWKTIGDRSGEAKTLPGLAKACIFRYKERSALSYYKQALSLHRMLGDKRSEAHTLHGISWTYYTLGDKQKALDYNNRALPLMQTVGDRWGEAAIFTNLGWISEQSGEKQQALDYYKQALPLMQATGDWDGRANTLYRLASVEGEMDLLPEALDHVQSALAITESLRARVKNRRLQVSYAAFVQQYHEFRINLLHRLHERSPSEGYDEAALVASEQVRARSLRELLTEANVNIRHGIDNELIEHERNLQKLITTKTDKRIRVLNSRHTEQQAAETTRELEELMLAYHDAEAKIRTANPHYAALSQAQTLTARDIQVLLDPDTVLLEYSLGEVRSHLWKVTSNSIEIFPLEKKSVIEAAAGHVYKLLTARTRKLPQEGHQKNKERIAKADSEFYQAASALSRLLLGPVAGQLEKKRLVIVGDGVLEYIPFGALPMLSTNENPSAYNYEPLVLHYEVVNLPSAATLALLRKHVKRDHEPEKTVAVFADPVFEASDERVRHKSLRTSADESVKAIGDYLRRIGLIRGQQPLPRLSYSRKEALAIASLVPEAQRDIVLDFNVNYDMVTGPKLGEYRFLHFATHAWLDTEQPELSGILLSLVDADGRPQQSGILRLGDIYNLNLPVELVTLSACETALGRSVKGEGMIGLTRGFMYAGAPRVLASLWAVDDVATADLMKLFYEGMLGPRKLRPPAALREAQREMYEKNRQASPFYWAGFVLQGEWR